MITNQKLVLLGWGAVVGIAVTVLLRFFLNTGRELDELARVDDRRHQSLMTPFFLAFGLVFKSRGTKLAQGQLRTRCRLGILGENLGASKGGMARYHLGTARFMYLWPLRRLQVIAITVVSYVFMETHVFKFCSMRLVFEFLSHSDAWRRAVFFVRLERYELIVLCLGVGSHAHMARLQELTVRVLGGIGA